MMSDRPADTRPTVEEVVAKLQLQPHPEGGFFAETFRDATVQLKLEQLPQGAGFKVGRPISTAIFFLVPTSCVSRLHRIPSQEVWHFYLGDPLTIFELDDSTGIMKTTVLGNDILAGQTPQHVVPAGAWFGSFPTRDFENPKSAENETDLKALGASVAALRTDTTESRRYTLVGCTVAPAFEFADFEMAQRADLLKRFPHAASYITTLTDP